MGKETMGIRLKLAETAKELDDVFLVRRQVYVAQEGKFGGEANTERYLTDRYDTPCVRVGAGAEM